MFNSSSSSSSGGGNSLFSTSKPSIVQGGNSGGRSILGNTGYDIVQLEDGGQFQIVQPQALPTSKSSSQSRQGTTKTSGNKTTNSKQTGKTTTTGRTITDNFDPTSRAAYTSLLEQLQGGGTDTMKQGLAALQALLGRSEDAEEEYTVDAARAQAQESIPLYARALREQILPGIYGAQEAAGLSGDAVTALLAQDQTTRLSEQASAAELAAIEAYAAISQNQQNITGGTASTLAQDPVQQAMQSLLGIGKGSYEDTRTSEVIDSIINTISNEKYDETVSENINTSSNENTQYQTVGGGEGGSGGSGGMFNSSGGTSKGSQQEDIALLASLLGPFQNLQHMNASGAGRGPLDALMTGRGQSGQNIQQLAGSLGIRL